MCTDVSVADGMEKRKKRNKYTEKEQPGPPRQKGNEKKVALLYMTNISISFYFATVKRIAKENRNSPSSGEKRKGGNTLERAIH